MNGYFQLVHSKAGTGVIVYPPTDGGVDVTTGEITRYLEKHKIGYDVIQIDKAVKEKKAKEEYFTVNKTNPISESYTLDVSKDLMTVTLRFYAPSQGANLTDSKEVFNELNLKKIKYGVNNEAIEGFFKNREYCTDIEIAKGKPPREGKDAEISYHFSTTRHPHPEMNADGSVDYHNLNLVNHCKKGDVLATLTPADMGDPGVNVYGNPMKPKPVKIKHLHFGNNIELSEDKLTITSMVDGHVSLQDGKVMVSNVLNLQNVDASTGNIDYDGSVIVEGDVTSGFSIKAGGNIEIKGNIEGAFLEAGNDIVMERGINGAGGGTVKAGGNVISKFIENTNVAAGASVTAESILHSKIEAGTEVNVSGVKGFIVGGNVIAGEKVETKILGGEMGTTTRIDVGADPQLKARIRDTMQIVHESQKNLQAILPTFENIVKKLQAGVTLPPEQAAYAKKLLAMKKSLEATITEKSESLCELQDRLAESHEALVIVNGTCYPGTTISIGELSTVVKKPCKYCKFVQKDGDVKMQPLR
ncbi:DUF342 domain-containing protein [Butyrivibrio sp. MC2013]|uniref:DUF342 domain-containing protein n=1 Tax=Butyrivibrio sp. MC2013 TaxID=1280686 RepID=UPI00040AF81B|nr:FapA family protein [Butyrivibrio sp. MC2013]